MKSKIFRVASTLIAAASVFMAATSASACYPFTMYQPKMPKTLIKED